MYVYVHMYVLYVGTHVLGNIYIAFIIFILLAICYLLIRCRDKLRKKTLNSESINIQFLVI